MSSKKKRKQENRNNAASTKNRFDVLDEESDSENSDMETMETNAKEGTTSNLTSKEISKPKRSKPPPLVVHDLVESHTKFVKILKDILTEKFYVKYHKDFTEVFTENQNEYQRLKSIWQQNNYQFHTYSDKNSKKRTLVIKGLHENTEVQDLKIELESLNYEVHSINLMKNTKQPMFMVTLNENVQIKQIKQEVKYLGHTKIIWDNYINKRRITQCHRCQAWGHATSNCYAKPACLKCAEGHLTKDCEKPKTIPAKCVNCGEDHPANATCCAAYKARLEMVESRSKTKIYKNTMDTRLIPTSRYQPLPTFSDHSQFPTIAYQKPTAKETPVQRPTATYTLQQNQPAAMSSSQPQESTAKKTTAEQDNTSVRNSYSVATTKRHQNTYNLADTKNNTSHVSELLQLSKEVRELSKIFDISKMITAVRTLKNQLLQCETEGEKFQIFLAFCDNLNG